MNRPKFRASALFPAGLLALGIVVGGCGQNQRNSKPDPASANVEQPEASPIGTEDVLTYHNDSARTGQYLNEKMLTTSNVNATSFGKVGFLRVQGRVDAEPLYVSNLNIAGASHHVVYVVTEHDLAYAFDTDNYSQLWKASLAGADETPSDNRNCGQVSPEIGVTSTPAIDLNAGPHGIIYIVAMSKDHHGKYFQRIHALDLASGAELPAVPRQLMLRSRNRRGQQKRKCDFRSEAI